LADNILIQILTDLMWRWQGIITIVFWQLSNFLLNDVSTQINTFITDKNGWTGY